ncbi:NAD-dependent epimerase/dehydratase family protein [Sphingobacterium sp. SRCM116780]|uniref:NAD-dependent epimerase/dehydratase family protein n=1 Tax=Sphingobacterium sp. SRCM116780 TaxID=2907623 RepID=UPI001F1D00E0|nr:NAD-dependent epimerase/dehydratase family protein [Sphingobacterium sp. SRCM116780]UIR55576.1 NAD-dependent epimerase/dehydratase family protein [Sphingobacterium sp. SRCM116780]
MILITGGTGFLGATLIKQLIDLGIDVVALKRSNSTIPQQLLSSSLIQWIDADICDYFELAEAFINITEVYHCAAVVSYQKRDAVNMKKVNVEGTSHIVNLCLEHKARLVHVSSVAALGSSKTQTPVNEKDYWEYHPTTSNYAVSKYESEMEVWRGIAEGLDAVIVNPSVIIGASAGSNGSGAIFSLVNKGLKYYPTGTVGVVDVEDVATIMRSLMENKAISGERFVINNVNLSNKDLLEKASAIMGRTAPKIAVSPTLLNIASTIATFVASIKNEKSTLTKDSARASSEKLAYSAEKLQEILPFNYKPLDRTLEEISILYNQHKTN